MHTGTGSIRSEVNLVFWSDFKVALQISEEPMNQRVFVPATITLPILFFLATLNKATQNVYAVKTLKANTTDLVIYIQSQPNIH